MLKGKDTVSFEDHWPSLRPTVLKLLKQESVSKAEWQDLFYGVHLICLWVDKGGSKIYESLQEDISAYIKQAQINILAQREEQALINAYIIEWRKFFTQSNYLPSPFRQLELSKQQISSSNNSQGPSNSSNATVTSSGVAASSSAANSSNSTGGSSSSAKNASHGEILVRELMLNLWNEGIFKDITYRLQESAMKLVQAERIGDAFDSQLVIGVRDSYVNLCSNQEDRLMIYRENFEAAYIKTTADFYRLKAHEQLQAHGVQAFMRYADTKLREEEARAQRYLEPSSFDGLKAACVSVLVNDPLPTLLAECTPLIRLGDTERLQLMFRLLDRVNDGVEPMLNDLGKFLTHSSYPLVQLIEIHSISQKLTSCRMVCKIWYRLLTS